VGQLEDWLEVPVLVLSVAWTALLILELIQGLSTLLQSISIAIWVVFGLEFAVRIQQLAPVGVQSASDPSSATSAALIRSTQPPPGEYLSFWVNGSPGEESATVRLVVTGALAPK
jgi:hypothetical protein